MRDFTNRSDATLIEWWNEGEGSLSWLTELEDELTRRGFETRKPDGTRRRDIPIPGNK